MIPRHFLIALALTASSVSALAQQQANLPPEAAVVAALDNHPTVTAAAARVDAARAGSTMLRKGSHEVTVNGSYISRSVDNEGRFNEFDATVSRSFRLPGKAALDREAGGLGIEVAQNLMEDTRHQAALQLSQLWFDWLTAGEVHHNDLANAGLLERALHAVERRAQMRDAATLDVEQARAALDQARGAAASSQAAVDEARALLAANFPDLPLPVDPPALGAPQMPAQDLATLHDLVIERSHEIRAADRESRRMEVLARRARAERTADPSLGVRGFSERGGMERGAGVVFSMPLGGGYRKAQAEQAGAEASAAMLQLANARRTVEAMANADLVNARNRLVAWRSIEAAAQSAVSAADRTARGQELGAIDLADMLLARRQAREAQRLEVEARASAIRALVKIQIDSHAIWMGDEGEEAAEIAHGHPPE